jgi:hypothetical protein
MNKQRFACLVGVLLLGLALSGTARADSYTFQHRICGFGYLAHRDFDHPMYGHQGLR